MGIRRLELDLATALIPLYVVSKVCCVNAYSYRRAAHPRGSSSGRGHQKGPTLHGNLANHIAVTLIDASATEDSGSPRGKDPSGAAPGTPVLVFSAVGALHVVGCSVAYAAFHVLSSWSQSSKLTDPNLVRVAIDLKNQYIGCVLVLALVGLSLFRQPTLDALLRTLLRVDRELADIRAALPAGLQSLPVNNTVWLRNVSVMFVAGVGVKAALEVSNCLMYIRDSGSPFSSYCLVLCIVPQTLCVVCGLQSVAYALLLRDRFAQLNRWLRQLRPHLARGSGPAFRTLGLIAATHSELTGGIRLLSQSFGLQNAILLLNQFITLVELGYNTCMMSVRFAESEDQQDDSMEDFVETVTWVGWFGLEIFVLCYCCHVTVTEAECTTDLLKLPHVYGPEQRGHFRMVSLEYMLLLNKKVHISCGGLFDIDLTLLFAIIGATTTYLIILIQFDQSVNV